MAKDELRVAYLHTSLNCADVAFKIAPRGQEEGAVYIVPFTLCVLANYAWWWSRQNIALLNHPI